MAINKLALAYLLLSSCSLIFGTTLLWPHPLTFFFQILLWNSVVGQPEHDSSHLNSWPRPPLFSLSLLVWDRCGPNKKFLCESRSRKFSVEQGGNEVSYQDYKSGSSGAGSFSVDQCGREVPYQYRCREYSYLVVSLRLLCQVWLLGAAELSLLCFLSMDLWKIWEEVFIFSFFLWGVFWNWTKHNPW